MLFKTRGIVLKVTDYSESSVVAQIFTEQFGLQAYLVNGVKKPKAKIRQQMLQPLHLLDMVVYHKQQGGLQRISELRQLPIFRSIPYDMAKSAVVQFLNEVLYKCLRHQTADEPLFSYVFSAITWLDETHEMPPHFHLHFLLRLTRFLGFYPAAAQAGQYYFDLKDGVFCTHAPGHSLVLMEPHTGQWSSILQCSIEALAQLRMNLADRRYLLSKIIDFYRLHIDGIGEIQSHLILEEVLS
ncbi:DNA replication and repair protein RecO [bacterium A37T11]|nr:DNA replication and repair protein RecO [bacterium A37T11]